MGFYKHYMCINGGCMENIISRIVQISKDNKIIYQKSEQNKKVQSGK